MDGFTTKERDHITRLIRKEVSFFNGWSVSEDRVESACFKAACKVEKYLAAKNRRELRAGKWRR